MELIPYLKDMGIAGAVVFAVLYFRSEAKADRMTQKLIDLLPLITSAMVSNTAAVDSLTAAVRGRGKAADGSGD